MSFNKGDKVFVMSFLLNDERLNVPATFIKEQVNGPMKGTYLVTINTVNIHVPKEKVLTENTYRDVIRISRP